jgi:4-alpha-glucanotransferase
VLWFEDGPAARLPGLALATVTTHDLPTVLGMWQGSDVADQVAAGLRPNLELNGAIRERTAARLRLAPGAPAEAVIEAVYRELGRAPSRVVLATLEDACLEVRRPNMPGTTGSWPNWSIPLPCTVEDLRAASLPRAIAAALGRGRRG